MGIQLAPRCQLCNNNAAMLHEPFCALCRKELRRVRDQVERCERSDWLGYSQSGYTITPRRHDQAMVHQCEVRSHATNACGICGRAVLLFPGQPLWLTELERHLNYGIIQAEDNAVKLGQCWTFDEVQP